jgi:hypothetical protein
MKTAEEFIAVDIELCEHQAEEIALVKARDRDVRAAAFRYAAAFVRTSWQHSSTSTMAWHLDALAEYAEHGE